MSQRRNHKALFLIAGIILYIIISRLLLSLAFGIFHGAFYTTASIIPFICFIGLPSILATVYVVLGLKPNNRKIVKIPKIFSLLHRFSL